MRIVGEIPHPRLKITIFKMDDIWSAKCEKDRTEIIYKFRDGSQMDSLDQFIRFFDEDICVEIEFQLDVLNQTKNRRIADLRSSDVNRFPEIF